MVNESPDAEAALLAATLESSANVDIPEENKTSHCLSCGAATPQAFCGECGLKNDDLRRSLFKLITETLGGIFSFEGRMWRTWAALIFKPGKVAREYADGKRTTYSAPIRVYLVMTFLLLGYLAITQTNLISVVVTPKTPEQIAAQEPGPKQVIVDDKSIRIVAEEKSSDAKDLEEDEAVKDPFEEAFEGFIDGASGGASDNEVVLPSVEKLNFEFMFFQPQSKFESLIDKDTIAEFVESMNIKDDENGTVISVESFDYRKAASTFLTNPTRFNQQFNTWLPRAMFFMVPMVMFLGVIYIRGPNALLYDHLIHAIYIHSVFFMGLLLAILVSKVLNGATVARILFVGLLIYLPISLKRMFGRGWFKTIWTTVNIGVIYLLMLLFVMVAISVYSLSQLVV